MASTCAGAGSFDAAIGGSKRLTLRHAQPGRSRRGRTGRRGGESPTACANSSVSRRSRTGSSKCTAFTSCASEMPVEHPRADAAIADEPNRVCVVQTADCLPVLLARTDARRVAAVHCGWRGLASGVLEATIAALETPPRQLAAWLGPAIGPAHFEVGSEVREAFMRIDPAAVTAFRSNTRGRWMCDLYRLAHQHLNRAGIDAIFGGGRCTFEERSAFFSFRRDGRCGRMATLIWIE